MERVCFVFNKYLFFLFCFEKSNFPLFQSCFSLLDSKKVQKCGVGLILWLCGLLCFFFYCPVVLSCCAAAASLAAGVWSCMADFGCDLNKL